MPEYVEIGDNCIFTKGGKMDTYELMIKTNDYLIKGGVLTDNQKQNIVVQFLSAVSNKETARRYYNGVKYPNNIDNEGRRMYPVFFIPPYNNGEKHITVMRQTPKTHILSANSYELEIIRLLYIFAPNNETVKNIVSHTLSRLKTTCFGNRDDGLGECFDASLIVLRFLTAVVPNETIWIKERLTNYHRYFNVKHRHWGVKWYYWLCLSELPFETAESEILQFKDELLKQINRSYILNNEDDYKTHTMAVCVIRNCLAKLKEYQYIKERLPYICEKDGRLHFDMTV